MRTLVDLPEDDVKWLDRMAAEQGKSRAALVREAVSSYRAKESAKGGIEQYYGMWKDRKDIGDGVDYQRRLRAEWTREWDPDYEDVKREFPDLFETDGQRNPRQEAAE